MHTVEGAAAQRMINSLIVVLLIESGAIARDDAIEGFRAARMRLAATVRDRHLRDRLLAEVDAVLQALADVAEQPVH